MYGHSRCVLTAVLQLCHHSYCSCMAIPSFSLQFYRYRTHCCRRTSTNWFRWANVLNKCEQMCLTNVIDVSYDMTGAQHVLWRTHCCRRASTTDFRWAIVLNECEQMCLTNVNKCAWRMWLTVAMTWLELNMYFGTVGVYQQVHTSMSSICT